MPPKITSSSTPPPQVNESNELMTNAQPKTFYSAQHNRSLSEISVGEILMKYQDDSHLLNHILVAKAQEDKRRTAEELRQAEEARLQTKFIEYELTQRNDNNSTFGQQTNNSSNSSLFTTSFIDPNDPFADHVSNASSLQAGMDTNDSSPLPMTTSEFHYNLQQQQQQQQQEAGSISSSSPSMDFITSSQLDLYNENTTMAFSCSPPADLPLFPAPEVKSSPIPTNKGKKKASTSKNIHRTLSYESVMTLSDLNIRPPSVSPPPPPPQPLDHDKVMEALRAKLRKSSSPYQNSRPTKPSPEPVPPPNTYPTTGVLLLNLKSRRRKSSVTKRSNSSTKP